MVKYINSNNAKDNPWANYEKNLADIGIPRDKTCWHADENAAGSSRPSDGDSVQLSSPECLECLRNLPAARAGIACMKCRVYEAL